VADQQLYVHIVRGTMQTVDIILQQVLAQALVLAGHDEETGKKKKNNNMPGTALIVCPDLAPDDFVGEYLDVHNMIVEGILPDNHLEGKIQVVPFHPQFVFEHNDDNDSDNKDKMEYWTNRSPYPMFHILKEDDVSHAVQIMKGDTDRVWQRNVYLLERMEEMCQNNGNDNDNTQQKSLLESYLHTGVDDPKGAIQSLVQQALEETSKEFPLLKDPIHTDDTDAK